ncbi:HNH endonuclease [Rhizobium leguminosarum]|uniref:HNH endonuclease n=1 Tax=Rhizobium leguminosarum TaxID=384 RepID=UPI001C96443C|nr:HNH endonuclease [Rhizobium leguminosarum]MBY5524059.1 HNH endonuclease [Rhizobium leguminosarum]
MKAVFDAKPGSNYDDDVSQHYQIPRRYLTIAHRCLDDWIVLRRPRADGGDLAYFATAKVAQIETDQSDPAFAYIRLTNFLPFDPPVSWRHDGRYAEQALRDLPQREVGVYLRGRSVRQLTDADFLDLIAAGLTKTLGANGIEALGMLPSMLLAKPLHAEPEDIRRIRVGVLLTNRIIREASFRRIVCSAYGNRCSISALKISDHAGNFEAQAAHIVPVSEGGPDLVQNGIALSATFHWLFDRHLFSIADDYSLLFDEARIPLECRNLFDQPQGRVDLPTDESLWPHPKFLRKHREKFLRLRKH